MIKINEENISSPSFLPFRLLIFYKDKKHCRWVCSGSLPVRQYASIIALKLLTNVEQARGLSNYLFICYFILLFFFLSAPSSFHRTGRKGLGPPFSFCYLISNNKIDWFWRFLCVKDSRSLKSGEEFLSRFVLGILFFGFQGRIKTYLADNDVVIVCLVMFYASCVSSYYKWRRVNQDLIAPEAERLFSVVVLFLDCYSCPPFLLNERADGLDRPSGCVSVSTSSSRRMCWLLWSRFLVCLFFFYLFVVFC